MYLIFDCSAMATYTNFKANFTDIDSWPRLLHISWILLGEDYKPIEDFDCIPTPVGFTIDDKSKTKAQLLLIQMSAVKAEGCVGHIDNW